MLHYSLRIKLLIYCNYLIFGYVFSPYTNQLCDNKYANCHWWIVYFNNGVILYVLLHHWLSYSLSPFCLLFTFSSLPSYLLLSPPLLYSYSFLFPFTFFSPSLRFLSFHLFFFFVTNYFLDLYLPVSVNLHCMLLVLGIILLFLCLHFILLALLINSILLWLILLGWFVLTTKHL